MTQRIPRVEAGVLHLTDQRQERRVVVGSCEWFAWLMEPATCSFVLRSAHGNLTIRKERRQRGGDYWSAYRRTSARLRKVYLGTSPCLSAARLERAALLLAGLEHLGVATAGLATAGFATPGNTPLRAEDESDCSAVPLLASKLAPPPARPSFVHRSRLTHWLMERRNCSVILINAPAGFGKTTLLGEWRSLLAARAESLAWVALDESDNDPARFWSYVVASLRMALPELPLDGLAFQRPRSVVSTSVVVATLLNAVTAVPRNVTLVLDDYHTITSQPVHDGLAFLLEHMPPRMRVIVASRGDPPLPLARLRARGGLAVLGAADLRCTPREVAAFLRRSMGLRLTPEAENGLAERTEGWFAGLQLAAQALRDSGATPDALARLHRDAHYVESYLVEEVVRRQPNEIQRYLLWTSLFDELTGPLCDAVTGRDDGEALLRRLAAAGVFVVPLDEQGRVYRYHQLFAEVLRSSLRRSSPDCVPELYRRAAAWHAAQGRAGEAVRYALAAGDDEWAADLLAGAAFPMLWERGEVATLHSWLSALPEALLAARPRLALAAAYTCLMTHRDDDAERWVAALAPEPPGAPGACGAQPLCGEMAFVRTLLSLRRGELDGSAALAKEALAQLPAEAVEARVGAMLALGMTYHCRGELAAAMRTFAEARHLGRQAHNRFLTSLALGHLSAVYRDSGKLREAERWCREAIRLARDAPGAPPAPYAALAFRIRAEILYTWNELGEALRHAEEAARLLWRMGDSAQLLLLYGLLMRLHVARGDAAAARVVFERMRDLQCPARDGDTWQSLLEVRWRLLETDVAAAGLWTPSLYVSPATEPPSQDTPIGSDIPRAVAFGEWAPGALVAYERVTLARLRLAQGRYDAALEVAADTSAPTRRAGGTALTIELLALEALAWHGKGESVRAVDALRCALELAEPGWYVRLFVDLGEPMAALLRRAAAHGVAPSYTQHLLAAFQAPRPGEALTAQEMRVLQLISAGCSNAAVAQQLTISSSTVKTHLYHVYQKLGARNRAHAIALARERGFLTAP